MISWEVHDRFEVMNENDDFITKWTSSFDNAYEHHLLCIFLRLCWGWGRSCMRLMLCRPKNFWRTEEMFLAYGETPMWQACWGNRWLPLRLNNSTQAICMDEDGDRKHDICQWPTGELSKAESQRKRFRSDTDERGTDWSSEMKVVK